MTVIDDCNRMRLSQRPKEGREEFVKEVPQGNWVSSKVDLTKIVRLDPSLFEASLPPFSKQTVPLTSAKPSSPRNWNKILVGTPSPGDFQISSFPTPDGTIPFPHEDIVDASDEWNLALVGYSLGRRPYYETLLRAFKIHDLPLCCWTPVGISKIATKVGDPLTVDALTASKSRLTYARVCVLVDSSAKYPDTIPISVEDKIFNLKIEYEWRPTVCSFCMSLNHSSSICPSNPNPEVVPPAAPPRGRSISRRTRPPSTNPKGLIPNPITHHTYPIPPEAPPPSQPLNNTTSPLNPPIDVSASGPIIPPSLIPSVLAGSWNIRGFNTSDKIFAAKNLVTRENLDMLCLLENRILPDNLSDPWFCSSHRVFENEESFHNFNYASPGRIWIKWNTERIAFSLMHSSKQHVTGIISNQSFQPCLLSVVYASNSFTERFSLWEDLKLQDPRDSMPWIIMGDFNCCRFQSEKFGGNTIPVSKIAPFNDFIFDTKLVEIPSSGIYHTWFNQRNINPILIRLDRMLANEAWFRVFPNSSYKALNYHISDHSTLILNKDPVLKSSPRFMYKNFWSKHTDFWSLLVTVFDETCHENHISWFYKRLKYLKSLIKRKDWASSNHIAAKCKSLEVQQLNCQMLLDKDPQNGRLQFIKFTITNTVVYWMRGALIPKTIIKAIGKICAKFLYFGGDQSKRLHLISWNKTCKPLDKGGLGIASLKAVRFALNCALICRCYNLHNPLSIWLRTRYRSPWKPHDPMDSAIWKNLCLTASCVRDNFKFIINDKSPASILWDHWCMGIKLSNHFPDLCHNFNAILKWDTVKDWTNNSSWNLPSYIGYDTANELNNLLSSIPILSNVTSNIVWKDNSKAIYKDFYKEYFEREASVDWHHFVWHKNKALRFSVFSWLALMGGLKTVDALARRNIYMTDPICPLCRCNLESLNHLFFECNYSFTVLVKLIPNFQYFYLRPSLIQSLNHVGSIVGTKLGKQGLLLTLNATVYYLWRERNNRRFGSSSHCVVTTTNLIAKVIKYKLSQRNYMESWKN
ncbi:hypothetical protein M5K25_020709 [Dendrobium thyrsiflorum]|uniref:Reverse transcriptase zinc-binding domain-containing protein n=1 Tax=Dendrobium thyrsiflorum TaxID=117978 RepID=A0ABD0UBA2_DENTH